MKQVIPSHAKSSRKYEKVITKLRKLKLKLKESTPNSSKCHPQTMMSHPKHTKSLPGKLKSHSIITGNHPQTIRKSSQHHEAIAPEPR